MGTSVQMIGRTYGHLAANADDYERELLDAFDRDRRDEDAAPGDSAEAGGRYLGAGARPLVRSDGAESPRLQPWSLPGSNR
jgi:hypothetical protein